jgi:hypothetical protein
VRTADSPAYRAPSTVTATNVSVIDNLPETLLYLPETSRTGPICSGTSTIEDDKAVRADETDPYVKNSSGSMLISSAAGLGAGATIAIQFDARLI